MAIKQIKVLCTMYVQEEIISGTQALVSGALRSINSQGKVLVDNPTFNVCDSTVDPSLETDGEATFQALIDQIEDKFEGDTCWAVGTMKYVGPTELEFVESNFTLDEALQATGGNKRKKLYLDLGYKP